jgi:hypothetical protein
VTDEVSEAEAETPSHMEDVRALFTYQDKLIVPDRGTITFTITVDSSQDGYPFTISDADGNLLGDGVIDNLDFNIESFHINQQPQDTPVDS